MKKLIGIFLGIISIVVMTGTIVYAVTEYHMSLCGYMEYSHDKVVLFISLMSINSVFMIYNKLRKCNNKIMLIQQVITLLLITYFGFKIYPDMSYDISEIAYVDVKVRLAIIMFRNLVVGFILFVVLELITWKKYKKTCSQFIIVSIILVIAIITSIFILDFEIGKQYDTYKDCSDMYDIPRVTLKYIEKRNVNEYLRNHC